MSRTFNKPSGFTMIELLVVTTIIIILTTIGLVSFQSAGQSARNGKRKADLETVRQALVLYRTDNGEYPDRNNFTTMMNTLNNAGYLNESSLQDPKYPTSTYVYTKEANGSGTIVGFELCADLEPDGTDYCVSNP